MRGRLHGDKGLTLIELLVVVLILGILASVVVVGTRGIRTRGLESACEIDRQTLVHAEEAFRSSHDLYAGSQAELVTTGLLHRPSTMHAVSGGTASDFTIVPLGGCR